MATLPTRSFSTIVSTITAGIQGRVEALIDFSVGSPLLAIAEAFAGAALWLQYNILQVLNAARLATSVGSDVDSFVADFSLTRLPASVAGGALTFSRFTASATQALVPNGATQQTQDGTQSFIVVADTGNPDYNAGLGGYPILSMATSVTATVNAVTPGPAANVLAGTVTVMTTPITGVDTVTNASAFSGGAAAETDGALKARFALNILGLAKGDAYGSEAALANLNVAIKYTLVDQFSYSGAFTPGYYYFVVDDGTGSPSAAFITNARVALNAVKPLGAWFGVFGPILVSADVNAIIAVLPGFDNSVVIGQVFSLIQANILALGLGAGLDCYQIGAWALSVPGVAPGGITGLTLNGQQADAGTIVGNPKNRIMPGAISVS